MKVKLENVRISFPTLFEPQQYKGQGSFNYSAKFIVEPGSPNDKAVREAIAVVAKEKWPKRAEALLEEFQFDKTKYPYIEGKRVSFEGAEGKLVLTAKRQEKQGRPLIVDNDKSPLLSKDGKPYAGCWVNASIEFWAQDGDTKGIRCTLRGVQFLRDGDAFGGGGSKPTKDEFDAVEVAVEDLV